MTEDTGLVAVELNQESDYFNRTYSVSQTPHFSNPAESIQPVESTPVWGSEQHNEDLTSRGCQSLNTEASSKGSEEEADVENEVPVLHSEEDFDSQGALEDSRPVASEIFNSSYTPEQQTERSIASLNTSSPAQTSSLQE